MDPVGMSEDELWAASSETSGLDRADVLYELGARLYRRGAYGEAATSAEHAAEIYRTEGRADLAGRALIGHSRALRRIGRLVEAADAAGEAADLLREQGDEDDIAGALLERALALVAADDDAAALPLLEDAIRLADSGGVPALAADAAIELGEVHGRAGRRDDAHAAFLSARDRRRGLADAEGVAQADDRIAAALIDRGLLEEALDRLRAALDVWEVVDDPGQLAYARWRLGWTLNIAGREEAAIAELEQARERYDELGNRFAVARCDEQAASALCALGRRADGLRLYRRAISLFDAVGADGMRDIARVNLANALHADDREAEAVAALRQVWTSASAREEHHTALGAATRLAGWLVADGDVEGARALLEEARPLHPRGDLAEDTGYLLADARCLLAEGRAAEADDQAAAVLAELAGSDLHGRRAQACGIRADAAEVLGMPTEEERHRVQAVLLHLRADEVAEAKRHAARLPTPG